MTSLHYAFIHAGRLLRRFVRDRATVMNTFVFPVLMLLVTRALFGDLMAASQGRESVDVLPICMLMVLAAQWMNSTYSASETIRLRKAGLTDRIAVTPGGAFPLFMGEHIYYFLRFLLCPLPTLVLGLILGMRIHNGKAALAIALFIVCSAIVTAALSSLFAQMTDEPETLMATTPLFMAAIFLSAGMVNTEAFVDFIQPVVRNNPVTHVIRGIVELNESGQAAEHLTIAGIWAAACFILFAGGALFLHKKRQALDT